MSSRSSGRPRGLPRRALCRCPWRRAPRGPKGRHRCHRRRRRPCRARRWPGAAASPPARPGADLKQAVARRAMAWPRRARSASRQSLEAAAPRPRRSMACHRGLHTGGFPPPLPGGGHGAAAPSPFGSCTTASATSSGTVAAAQVLVEALRRLHSLPMFLFFWGPRKWIASHFASRVMLDFWNRDDSRQS